MINILKTCDPLKQSHKSCFWKVIIRLDNTFYKNTICGSASIVNIYRVNISSSRDFQGLEFVKEEQLEMNPFKHITP